MKTDNVYTGKENSKETGEKWERYAAGFLEKHGYHILEQNYRCRQGEIDIIARKGKLLIFAEVKYRGGNAMGSPEEAVNLKKQRKISRCALDYMTRRRISDIPVRFDVLAISGAGEIRHYEDAFDYRE